MPRETVRLFGTQGTYRSSSPVSPASHVFPSLSVPVSPSLWDFLQERDERSSFRREYWDDSPTEEEGEAGEVEGGILRQVLFPENEDSFQELLLSPSQFRGMSEFDQDLLPFCDWANGH